jgi:hypothetical protein
MLKSPIVCDITPHSPLKVNRRFGGTLKMGVKYCSKTSVDFQRTMRRYFPEDRTLHNPCCENLES